MSAAIVLPLVGASLLLWAASEALVRGSVAVARRLGVHPVLVGVVLMGYGTSLAELLTGLRATAVGAPDLALGTVLGSNVFNVLAILGLCALMAPLALERELLRRDAWLSALAAMLGAGVLIWGPMDRMDGALFLLLIATYTLLAFLTSREPGAAQGAAPLWPNLALALAGLGGVVAGAGWLADSALALAPALGLTQALIGAGFVAAATSLPELTASLAAARRGEAGLAVGNVLGSTIFNTMAVLGGSAMIAPLEAGPEALGRDLPAMLAATALLAGLILATRRIGRGMGAALLALYAAYLGAMF